MLHCSEVWGLAENGWGSRRRCPAVAAPCWALMARGAAGYWRELFAVTGCRDEDGRAQRRGREAGNDVAAGRRSCRAGSLLDSARKWRCTGGFGSNVLLPVMANVGSAPLRRVRQRCAAGQDARAGSRRRWRRDQGPLLGVVAVPAEPVSSWRSTTAPAWSGLGQCCSWSRTQHDEEGGVGGVLVVRRVGAARCRERRCGGSTRRRS